MSGVTPGLVDAVVVGTSAGGVQALSVLLPVLPRTAPFAVLVVIHLPRERPSLLVEIFSAKCAARVREAEDKEPIEPGTIYFAPPDYHLLVERGPSLALSVDDPVEHSRPSVDVLFESAAEVFRERLVGIVLTGANQDGTAGLRAVRAAAGAAIVQDPDTAQASLMPASALKSTPAATVMTLDAIAEWLRQLSQES